MKALFLATISLLASAQAARAENAKAPAPAVAPKPAAAPMPAAPAASTVPASAKNPEATDISGLENDYWRPNKDELEVVQNRRYDMAHRWEFALQYGIFQGQDFVDSKSLGATLTYNISNAFFVEASYLRITNSPNDLLTSVQNQYNFTPSYSAENNQEVLSVGWVPIYAKFALIGKEISHFEMYIAPGIGNTQTQASHTSYHLTIGEKFFITEHLLFRVDWRITKFTDQISTPTGSTSVAHGGPGYVNQSETTNNIIFGLGVMY